MDRVCWEYQEVFGLPSYLPSNRFNQSAGIWRIKWEYQGWGDMAYTGSHLSFNFRSTRAKSPAHERDIISHVNFYDRFPGVKRTKFHLPRRYHFSAGKSRKPNRFQDY